MTDKIRDVMFRWKEVDVCLEGGDLRRVKVMVPHNRFARLCNRQFELEEDYALGPVDNVPGRSRASFFMSVHNAWDSLPEDSDEVFASEEHLRKRALVKAGWADHSVTNWKTKADARRHAVDLRKIDGYAVIAVNGEGDSWTVDVWVARSIAAGQIKGEEFKGVKMRAERWLASLSGCTTEELKAAARMS